jgi:hypothetical protein
MRGRHNSALSAFFGAAALGHSSAAGSLQGGCLGLYGIPLVVCAGVA